MINLVWIFLVAILGFPHHRINATNDQQSRPLSGPQEGGNLKLVASITLPASREPMGARLESIAGELYLIDAVGRRIEMVNWKTGERGDWRTLDPSSCSTTQRNYVYAVIMRTRPYIAVLNCNAIELLENKTLRHSQTVAENDDYRIDGFELSPDERLLSVFVNRQGKLATRVYETDNWKLVRELDLDHGHFGPNGRTIMIGFARSKKASSHGAADECGLQFYDINSGQRISEFARSADGNDDVCPRKSGQFLPGQPNRLITDDPLRAAISEWDLSNGKLVQHLSSKIENPGPAPSTESLDISFDGKFAAAVRSRQEWNSEWGTTIWDLTTGTKVYEIALAHSKDPILRARFSTDGNNLVFVYSDRADIYEYRTE